MHSSDLSPWDLLPHEDVVFLSHVSLQAILVLDSPEVDLRLWNATVAEMEASGKYSLSAWAQALRHFTPFSYTDHGWVGGLGGLHFCRGEFTGLETDEELSFHFFFFIHV